MFDRNFAVQRRLAFGLTVAGFAAGAVFGMALTVFGKIVAGAPPATLGNYFCSGMPAFSAAWRGS